MSPLRSQDPVTTTAAMQEPPSSWIPCGKKTVPVGWSGLLMLMYAQGHPRSQKEKQRQLKWLRCQYRTLWLLDIRLAAWLIAKWAAICPVGSQNHMASDVMPVGLVAWGVVRQQPSWWSSPCECGIWMVPGSKNSEVSLRIPHVHSPSVLGLCPPRLGVS